MRKVIVEQVAADGLGSETIVLTEGLTHVALLG